MLQYIPKYVRQDSDMEYGDLVTHENYNEKLNLNTTQGDYNTEVLDSLFNGDPTTDAYHIPYVDAVLQEHTDDITAINTVLGEYDGTLSQIVDTQTDFQNQLNQVLGPAGTVKHAIVADALAGASDAANNTYYGKDNNGVLGFINLPEFLYVSPIPDTSVTVDGIYFLPQLNSVTEDMLTSAVRTKLNRQSITSYEDLSNLPAVNGHTLLGNSSLSDLGAQPVGNYITNTDLATYLNDYLTETETINYLQNNYYTNTQVQNYVTQALNDYPTKAQVPAVQIGTTWVGTPKVGDILITLVG